MGTSINSVFIYRDARRPPSHMLDELAWPTKTRWQWHAINNGVIKENTVRSLFFHLRIRLFPPRPLSNAGNILTSILCFPAAMSSICPHHMSYTSRGQFMKYVFNLFKFLRTRVLPYRYNSWTNPMRAPQRLLPGLATRGHIIILLPQKFCSSPEWLSWTNITCLIWINYWKCQQYSTNPVKQLTRNGIILKIQLKFPIDSGDFSNGNINFVQIRIFGDYHFSCLYNIYYIITL